MKHITVDVTHLVKTVEGMSYVAWADALSITNPSQHVALHPEGGVVHPIFGGGYVAVDQPVSKEGKLQRTTLVILNTRGAPVPYNEISSRDVGDAINRCRARSAAVVDGLGLGLYLDQPNGPLFLKQLGVNQGTSDLTTVAPWLLKKGAKEGTESSHRRSYLPWAAAIAAARLTDPEFRWSVAEFSTVDENGVAGVQPYIRVPYGYLVAVDLYWKGREHREFLPIMGVLPVQTSRGVKKLDHQALPAPNAADWHKACMRALAKGIALMTGYGRSAYADEIGSVGQDDGALEDERVQQIRDLVVETGADMARMLSHFGAPSIEAASAEVLTQMLAMLQRKRAGATPLLPKAQPPVETNGEAAPPENAPIYERIEALAKDKAVKEEILLGFFKTRNIRTATQQELERALKALERMTPSHAAAAG